MTRIRSFGKRLSIGLIIFPPTQKDDMLDEGLERDDIENFAVKGRIQMRTSGRMKIPLRERLHRDTQWR